MDLRVVADNDGHRLAGDGVDVALVNQFLQHLSTRNFAAATRRANAYDLLCFGRFCAERGLSVAALSATDVFDWLEWQGRPIRDVAARQAATVVACGRSPARRRRR
jgi:integrase/recombinase XerC